MLDGRIYRAALVPLVFVVVIVGFSLSGRPAPFSSTLAPDAFNGSRAFSELSALVKGFPGRRPGGQGDARLADYVAGAIRQAGGGAGGFEVSERTATAQTLDGERTLRTVVAQRPGTTGESAIAIVAHRDGALRGSAAELSATAALVELARVFGHSQTRRAIVLVSTSGGTGGYGGAADFASHLPGPIDAAIVLGDLAGRDAHKPFVVGFSSGVGAAPEELMRTLSSAISQEVGTDAGEPGLGTQLAQLAVPLSTSEQAPLVAAGIPAAMVQLDGQRGPRANERVSQSRLENFGRAVLSGVYALDEAPDLKPSMGARVGLGRKTMPGWAVRLLVLALVLAPLLTCVDGLARMRRRREPVGRWLVWTVSCAFPFAVAGLWAMLLGALGIMAAPGGQPSSQALAEDGSATGALAATVLVLVLALAAWPALARRLAGTQPSVEGAGLAATLVLLGVGGVAWLFNPFASLLAIPAAHLWLVACTTPRPRRRALAITAIGVSVLPVVAVAVVYARMLGLGPIGLAESTVIALAGGQIGLIGMLMWSLALGCLLAIGLVSRGHVAAPPRQGSPADEIRITTRGPLSYAGPGSLGGTSSALRH